jgi:dipeptidyl aminopeptidase/acylaminoacyl peptidase
MTQRDDLDQLLSAWLDDPYTPPAPRYLDAVLERTRRTRQRPAWANLERWIPMADKVLQPTFAASPRVVGLLLLALLIAALAAAAIIGSRLLVTTPVIPQGDAAVLAFGSMVSNESGSQSGGEIFTVRADGTDLRQLTSGTGIRSEPTWSPDGRRIAYRDWRPGGESIVVMDAGGGNQRTLATYDAYAVYCVTGGEGESGGMAWSPDGTSLVFPTSPVCGSRFELFIVATDGSSPATPLLTPGTDGLFPAWSPDGKRIAMLGSEGGATAALYIVHVGSDGALAGGLHPRRIGPVAPTIFDEAGFDLDLRNAFDGPRWSPDGSELVVADPTGVVVMQPDGSDPRLVATPGFNPAWSPDGRNIAFHRTVDPSEYFLDRPCTVRTWVVGADGTNERRLEALGDGCLPAPLWSPDGTRVSGIRIVQTADDLSPVFHVGIDTIDDSRPLVVLPDGRPGSWQPVVAPLPPAPSFSATPSTP